MARQGIPVNFVFSPSWWHKHYGIAFQESFYLDVEARIENDRKMRKALYERFGPGVGEADPQPRPVIGSRHIAGGYAVPGSLGVPIRFIDDQGAWPIPMNLSRDAAMALRVPDLANTWPMNVILPQIEELRSRFGYVVGDLNPGGLLNTALEIRGQQFFLDLVEDPEACDHVLGVVCETQIQICRAVRMATGTCAVSTNRSVLDADPSLCLTSNCSTHMISRRLYEERILPFELKLAGALRPFGVHHCGSNLHKYAPVYSRLGARFFDVGWGSHVAEVSRQLPGAFLNLRMNPVRAMQCTAEELYEDAAHLLRECGRRELVGLCCINMDASTPDENVRSIVRAARDYERSA